MEKDSTKDSPQDYKESYEFFIAGVQHHQMKTVLGSIEEGTVFQLVPEPTNKFDPNAVRIEYQVFAGDSVMCGYVPRKFSAEVSADIAIGKHLICTAKEVNKTAKPWEQCKVAISEIEEA